MPPARAEGRRVSGDPLTNGGRLSDGELVDHALGEVRRAVLDLRASHRDEADHRVLTGIEVGEGGARVAGGSEGLALELGLRLGLVLGEVEELVPRLSDPILLLD